MITINDDRITNNAKQPVRASFEPGSPLISFTAGAKDEAELTNIFSISIKRRNFIITYTLTSYNPTKEPKGKYPH